MIYCFFSLEGASIIDVENDKMEPVGDLVAAITEEGVAGLSIDVDYDPIEPKAYGEVVGLLKDMAINIIASVGKNNEIMTNCNPDLTSNLGAQSYIKYSLEKYPQRVRTILGREHESVIIGISKFEDAGEGLFALKVFKRGEKICDYVADRLTKDKAFADSYVSDSVWSEATGIWAWDGNSRNGYGVFANDGLNELTHNATIEYDPEISYFPYLCASKDIQTFDEISVPYGHSFWDHSRRQKLGSVSQILCTQLYGPLQEEYDINNTGIDITFCAA